jgi:hypothetical protein
MRIDDCRGALLSLGVAATLTGCVFSVPEPTLIREPRPEPVPLRIGVYYPPELRSFTYRHHLTDTAWILGKPSVRLLSDAVSLLFADVVEVPRPGAGTSPVADVAGIIEPRLVSASAVYWSDEHVKRGERVQPVRVTYGFTLYTPDGRRVASWEVTGRGEEPVANPLGGVQTLKRNFEYAMREAAWKFTSEFRDVPDVRRWLDQRGVP